MFAFLVLVALIVVGALYVVGLYNGLVARRNQYQNSFAQIDVQLKRRYDLIPNLVETAKGYLKHEREVLENVIQARGTAVNASARAAAAPGEAAAMAGLNQAEAGLSGALGRLFALAEAYPDLKANQTMAQLSEELSSTENRIAFSRQAFNDAVMAYNVSREKFPGNVIANSFNFQPAHLLEATEKPEERAAPKVSFT